MDEGLKIHVGADTSELSRELQKAGKQTDKFSKAVSRDINTRGFDDYTQKVKALKKPTTDASYALLNLGRIAQDAPFGFMGISNNLNPAFESMQRLRKEAGSTGGFIKALTAGLMGPAGLGLALSAVTAATLFSQMGLRAWGGAANGAKKEAAELSGFLGTTKDQLEQVNQKFAEEASRVMSLVTALRSGKLSHEQIKSAKQELIRISPTYFKNLDAESSKIGEVTAAYNNYNNSLIKAIENQIKTDKLTKAISDRFLVEEKNPLGLKEFQKLISSGQTVEDILKRLGEKTIEDIKSGLTAVSGQYSLVGKEAQLAYDKQLKAEEKTKTANKQLESQLFNIASAYKAVQDVAGTIDSELVKIVPKDLKKQVEEVKRVWKLQRVEVPLVFSTNDGWSSTEGYKAFKKKIEDMAKKDPLYIEAPQIKISSLGDWSDKLSAQAKQSIAQIEAVRNMAYDTAQIVGTQLAGAFDSVFRTIAEEGTISMKQVGNALKQLIIELTSAAIRAAILAAVLKITGKGTMGGFGSLFQGILSGGGIGTGMATGGIVPPGYPNDTFPARLTSNEAVIPLDRIDSVLGGMNGGRLVAEVSGSKLKFILDRTDRSQGRSF